MINITVHRYPTPSDEERAGWPEGVSAVSDSWQGYVEPDDLSWIVFVAKDGTPTVFLRREAGTGAVIA